MQWCSTEHQGNSCVKRRGDLLIVFVVSGRLRELMMTKPKPSLSLRCMTTSVVGGKLTGHTAWAWGELLWLAAAPFSSHGWPAGGSTHSLSQCKHKPQQCDSSYYTEILLDNV